MSAKAGMTWTYERVECLKTLWIEGLSASQIASQLGGVTRNAVIGKIHRLGLSGRQSANLKPGTPNKTKASPKLTKHARRASNAGIARALAPAALPETEVEQEVKADNIVPMARYLTLQQLDTHTCRWPIRDPQTSEFRFCGAPTDPGQVYCRSCSKSAYLPKGDHPKTPARMNVAARWSQYR